MEVELISHKLLARTVGSMSLLFQKLCVALALTYGIAFAIKCFGTTTMLRTAIFQIFFSAGLIEACMVVAVLFYETTRNALLALNSSQSEQLPKWPFTITFSIICLSVIISEGLSLSLNLRIYYIIIFSSTSFFFMVAGVFIAYHCRRIVHISQQQSLSAGVSPPNLTNYYVFVCAMVILMAFVSAAQIMEIFSALNESNVPVFNEKEPVVYKFDVFVILVVIGCSLLTVWPWKSLCPGKNRPLNTEIRSQSGMEKGLKSPSSTKNQIAFIAISQKSEKLVSSVEIGDRQDQEEKYDIQIKN
eukprot:TRINITY_DN3831_c0_g2_i3.p1 TRINITY_DN3831_c0_g2~~TRINITY_DN3831_c0_g2_i3.p1  ORF type:complete len:302 (-),score=39.46 TRINITY_DN3831_c0_g2_i3:30-935(-)